MGAPDQPSIDTWLRGYLALKAMAAESRGLFEINTGVDSITRWPRTTGADVLAIAAVVDPYVREQALIFGEHELAGRWQACVEQIERIAISDLFGEYPGNRTFWRTLPAICMYMHWQNAPLPRPEIWDAMLAQLVDAWGLHSTGPGIDVPFKIFEHVATFDELFIAQYKYLRDLRGADFPAPEPDIGEATAAIPRTTNHDVILLGDYWTKQLEAAKPITTHSDLVKRWTIALVDLDELARPGDPNAIYRENHGFWRALERVALHVAMADRTPTKWNLAISALEDAVKDRGPYTGFGAPLLVGAGLIGLFLISRGRPKEQAW